MSRNAASPARGWISGLRNGRGSLPAFIRASLVSAQKPAQTGALQLVPPICTTLPASIKNAPSSGSAVTLTSGTRRLVPFGTELPFCHAGRLKNRLLPPPPLVQPISCETAPLVFSTRLVPPTATTAESDDEYSACVGPPELCPVWSGFEPASPVDTNTLTPAAASWR